MNKLSSICSRAINENVICLPNENLPILNINKDKSSFPHFQSINKIISKLYDDTLEVHDRIINFFHALREEMYFDKAAIIFFTKDDVYKEHTFLSINCNEEAVKHYNEHYCQIDDVLPILDQTSPIVFRSSDVFNRTIRKSTTYFKEYLLPNNCIYSIDGNLSLQNSIGLKGGFHFYRGIGKNDFTDSDIQIIKVFQPHLSNILKHFGEKTDSTNTLFALENYNFLTAGIGILDHDYHLIRYNTNFKRLTTKFDSNNVTYNKIYYKVIQLCKNLNTQNNKISYEYKIDDEPIFLEVAKFSKANDLNCFQYYSLIYDLSHFFIQTLNQAKEKYSLTSRELDIIKSILNGLSNKEISEKLYISISTIKKYLASIYNKMGIKNQKHILEKLNLL